MDNEDSIYNLGHAKASTFYYYPYITLFLDRGSLNPKSTWGKGYRINTLLNREKVHRSYLRLRGLFND